MCEPPTTHSDSRERKRHSFAPTARRPCRRRSVRRDRRPRRGDTPCTRHAPGRMYGRSSGVSADRARLVRLASLAPSATDHHLRLADPAGNLAQPDGAALSPFPSPRLWQRDAGAERHGPRRSLTGDQFPASDVVADQRHVLVVGAPRASQITARRCAPTRFTDAASAARSILPDGRCWQTARSHWSEVP
jgi:hypothetical protein